VARASATGQRELPWAELEPQARPRRLQDWTPQAWPLAEGWRPAVEEFLASGEGERLAAFIRARLDAGAVIYPPHPLRALELTPLASVHAVVLGQDPYHGPGQAEGLAFSVADGVKPPPSLRNIFKELGQAPETGSLTHWARSGVLLLNAVLTVEEGQPAGHAKKGWEALTDRLLALVAATASPCVYPGCGPCMPRQGRQIRSMQPSTGARPGAAIQPSVAAVGPPAASALPRQRLLPAGPRVAGAAGGGRRVFAGR